MKIIFNPFQEAKDTQLITSITVEIDIVTLTMPVHLKDQLVKFKEKTTLDYAHLHFFS